MPSFGTLFGLFQFLRKHQARLEPGEPCGHDKPFRGAREIPALHCSHGGDELVHESGYRNSGEVDPLPAREFKQQFERAIIAVKLQLNAVL